MGYTRDIANEIKDKALSHLMEAYPEMTREEILGDLASEIESYCEGYSQGQDDLLRALHR